MLCVDSLPIILLEKALQSSMREPPNHSSTVTCNVSGVKRMSFSRAAASRNQCAGTGPARTRLNAPAQGGEGVVSIPRNEGLSRRRPESAAVCDADGCLSSPLRATQNQKLTAPPWSRGPLLSSRPQVRLLPGTPNNSGVYGDFPESSWGSGGPNSVAIARACTGGSPTSRAQYSPPHATKSPNTTQLAIQKSAIPIATALSPMSGPYEIVMAAVAKK